MQLFFHQLLQFYYLACELIAKLIVIVFAYIVLRERPVIMAAELPLGGACSLYSRRIILNVNLARDSLQHLPGFFRRCLQARLLAVACICLVGL